MLKSQRAVCLMLALAGTWGCGRVTSDLDDVPSVPSVAMMPSAPTGSMPASIMPPELQPNLNPSEKWSWSACGPTPRAGLMPSSAIFGDAGASLYVAQGDGGISHYDTLTGRELKALPGSLVGARRLALSLDGKLLADVGSGSLLLRDGASLEVLKAPGLSPACSPDGAVEFSPSGKYLLLGGTGACVVNVQSGAVAPLPAGAFGFGVKDEVLFAQPATGIMATSPDGLGVTAGFQLNILEPFEAVSSSDGRYVAVQQVFTDAVSGANTFRMHLWRVQDGAHLWGQSTDYSPVAFSQNSTHVVTAGAVYSVQDGSFVRALRKIPAELLEVSGDERFAVVSDRVSGRAEPYLRLFPLAGEGAARVLGVPTGAIVALAMSANGAALVSGGYQNRAWSLASDRAEPVLAWMAGDNLTTVPDVSSDGSLVTIAGDGGALIDMRTGVTIKGAPPLAGVATPSNAVLSPMRFSPNARLVAGAEYGLGAALRSVPDLQQVALLKTRDRFPAAVFSPDSEWVYTSSPEKFRVDGALAWAAENVIDPGAWPSRWVELSDKGDVLLVSGCSERDIPPCLSRVYSAVDGTFLLELPFSGRRPRISKEGDWVLADGELFHLKTRELRRFDALATAAVFTPNGDIFTGHADATLTRYCRSSL